MSTLIIDLDDHTVRLIENAALAANQSVNDWVRESICNAAGQIVEQAPQGARISHCIRAQ